MALFRKFFYRKPPDGLLEISERVFVFDCCFTNDVVEDNGYKVYMGGIVGQLREYFPDASFMVFNFREGENKSQIANILSDYDMTVMDYPRQYESCPLLSMEMIHHFLRSSESWLSLGQRNVLLMHCEFGGWPVLAFMLAALLIYRKQYTGEQKTLDMIYKQAPREFLQLMSPLNPLPSQLRYLQYISRRNVGSERPPLDRALTLDCVILRVIPDMDKEGGCRPIFRIHGQDPLMVADRTPEVLFSTPRRSNYVRYYKQADCELIKIDIHCHTQGDVVLACISLDNDLEHEEMIFRVTFNTAFIRSNILMLNRDEVDIVWNAKDQFPKDFRAEVLFSEMDSASSVISDDFLGIVEKKGLPVEAFAKVQEIFNNVDWLDPKADVALNMLHQTTGLRIIQEKSSLSAKLEKLETDSPEDGIKNKVNIPPLICAGKEKLDRDSPSTAIKDSFLHQASGEKVMETPEMKAGENDNTKSPSLALDEQLLSQDVNAMKKIGSQQLQVALQRPAKPNNISQRIRQTSLSNPASHCNSLQGSPVPLSRYHSAPSVLGITALLQDHAEPTNKEGAHSVTSPVTFSAPLARQYKPLQPSTTSVPLPSHAAPSLPLSIETTAVMRTPSTSSSPSLPLLHPHYLSASDSLHNLLDQDQGNLLLGSGHPSSTPAPPPPHVPLSLSGTLFSPCIRNSVFTPPPPPPPPPPLSRGAPTPTINNSISTPPPLPPPIRNSTLTSPPPPPPSSTSVLVQSPIIKNSSSTAPPPPPPPPLSSRPPTIKNSSSAPPPPPALDSSSSSSCPSSTPLHMKSSGVAAGPPPPLPLHSKPAGSPDSLSSVPPPPPPPRLASTDPLSKSSHHVPPLPPPLATFSNGLSRAGGASPQSHSAISNGNIPPSPGPPFSAKGRLQPRTSPRNQAQSAKKTSLKPYHWLKLTRAMQGSLWAEAQKLDEASKAPEFDMSELESLFSASVPNSDHGRSGSKSNRRASGPKSDKINLIELRRAYNCEIMLTKVKVPLPVLMVSPTVHVFLMAPNIDKSNLARANTVDTRYPSAAPIGSKETAPTSGVVTRPTMAMEQASSQGLPPLKEILLFDLGQSKQAPGSTPRNAKDSLHFLKSSCQQALLVLVLPFQELCVATDAQPIEEQVASLAKAGLVLALDNSALDVDQVDNLIRFCPTKEEMDLLKNYNGDKENLGKCEQVGGCVFTLHFLSSYFILSFGSDKAVPHYFVILFIAVMHLISLSLSLDQLADLRISLNVVNSTSEEARHRSLFIFFFEKVRNSVKLKRIMQTILSLGNALNHGTARGSAVGFRLDSLLKLTDTRARNNKLTLMHYLCKVLAEKLPELLDFAKDLTSLEASTKIQLKYLAEEMQAVSKGLEKVVQELTASENDGPVSESFCEANQRMKAVQGIVSCQITLHEGAAGL
ncbi:hypothetical protein RJ639_046273 [Escallonia herrerae]|uniref:Formin-like protein n=1 Tax=Escallonia herrerae TaxID=1293975 RepID=A0AA88W4A6_9ASTE|nr:hypothetical protein RJ639_046273 [Escallonia herrerae]